MFIYIKEKNTIINSDQLCSIRSESYHSGDGKDNGIYLIFQMLRDIHVMENMKISLTKPIESLLQNDYTKEYITDFTEYFLLTLMKYLGVNNITISEATIRQTYTFYKYWKYNQQRIAELSGMNVTNGIGKDVADCFLAREQDLQKQDESDSSLVRSGLGQLAFNEKTINEFFENERVFRQTFDIPIDPNDKEGIDAFDKQREAVLSGKINEPGGEPPAKE